MKIYFVLLVAKVVHFIRLHHNIMELTTKTHPLIGQYYLFDNTFKYIIVVDYTYNSDSVSVYWLEYTTDYVLKKDTNSLASVMNNVYDNDI
jgi:hypothetical protein